MKPVCFAGCCVRYLGWLNSAMNDLFPVAPDEMAALAADDAAVSDLPLSVWPKLLVELLDAGRAALIRAEVPTATAEEHARRIILAIAELHGGHSLYLPTGATIREAMRDDSIWRDMGRIPVADLARRWNVTETRVYQIYRKQRALRQKRQQPKLI